MTEQDLRRIENTLAMDEPELLMEIARASNAGISFHSPESLLRRGKAFLTEIQSQLRKSICHRQDLLDLPEVALAGAIFEILSVPFVPALATVVAAYLVKRGLRKLCEEGTLNE